jgi:hypothetical protein
MNAHGKVYIIESPKPHEAAAGIFEGKGLLHMLELSGVPCRYSTIRNLAEFRAEFAEIANDLGPVDHRKVHPFFHLSLHGN